MTRPPTTMFIICAAIVLSLIGESKQQACSSGLFDYCPRGGDCYGWDIRSFTANSETCRYWCSADCNCVSVQHIGTTCWLKTHRCSWAELNWDDGYNDWVKVNKGQGCALWGSCSAGMYDYCYREADCYGHDIKIIKANSEDCKAACSKNCRCVSVQNIGDDCWLKDHRCTTGELNWKAGYNDWVKVSKGAGCAAWYG